MIILLIKIWFICWFLTHFEPLDMILEGMPNKLLYNIIKLLLTCLMCSTFWLTLIVTQSLWIASIMAFISFWYDKIIGPMENRIKLN